MRTETRQKFNAYLGAIAQLNGVDDTSKKFAVAPTVQQTLEQRIQESSAFLQAINNYPVTEKSGQKIGMGVSGPIASRTDTIAGERQPRDVSELDDRGYECFQTNYDTAIRYDKLDLWAKFPNFQALLRDAILKQCALDRIMIGWNGTHVAANTNLVTYPLLQDVNKGWLQHAREYNDGSQVMDQVSQTGKIKIGKSVALADGYKNLDALVMDMIVSMIKPWHRAAPDLVVLMSDDLLADKYFPLVNQAQPNTEAIAADMIISQKRVGGKQAVTVPYFPSGTLVVTKLKNLSIYVQEGARRRHLEEQPARDRVVNFESSNDAYVVEDFECFAAAENIELVAPVEPAQE